MKRFLFVAALVLAVPATASAQALKIGYINSQNILAEAPGAKEAQAQFDSDMASYKAEVSQMAAELDGLVKQYEQQQAMLSPAAKQTRETDIRTKQQAYQDRLSAIDQRAAQ